jgi:hypothetical protein
VHEHLDARRDQIGQEIGHERRHRVAREEGEELRGHAQHPARGTRLRLKATRTERALHVAYDIGVVVRLHDAVQEAAWAALKNDAGSVFAA